MGKKMENFGVTNERGEDGRKWKMKERKSREAEMRKGNFQHHEIKSRRKETTREVEIKLRSN